jgi:hypothetical protein
MADGLSTLANVRACVPQRLGLARGLFFFYYFISISIYVSTFFASAVAHMKDA